MAKNDLSVWTTPAGGVPLVRHFPMNASEAFFEGEPVSVNADGECTESATEPVPADFMGIALGGPGAGRTNPATGANWATGDLVPVAIPIPGTTIISQNWSKAGVAFDDTAPVATDIGDAAGLILISNKWGIQGAPDANDGLGRIVDILNHRKESILQTGETLGLTSATGKPYYIVMNVISYQESAGGTEASDPVA